MLSSSPASCTSPNPDKENPSKKVHWASGRRRTSSTDSESKSQSDPFRPRSRKPSRLTVKYDRGQLQRWVEMEQWVDTQVQELFQDQPTSSEPRSTWRLSWNYPQRSRRLSWRLFSKTAPAPQSLLSLSCSVNSRNFGDSVDLRNKPCETSFISLSTAQSALNPWIFGWVGNHSLGPRRGTWRMRRDI
ncbi:LOW QUALITY PROTEIN: protein phosphatase 1 regulatory subunit 14D [Bubalus kerabau]|uniref:LOW QUALITY PROTEIN: protein phosphatase 1 regulatory subunit 14D n=1 Tax=Bubalus carabanensis TaxID=3119969 RepID=UPI00244E8B78|nr:LOW QUALITY PROTEIN: protein phosphatase 1 regulatory subunit 14D [Bubalus carabanensis]